MLWNRLSYAMALWMAGSLSACAATPPAENKCPAFQGKHALVSADVFSTARLRKKRTWCRMPAPVAQTMLRQPGKSVISSTAAASYSWFVNTLV